jgi:hypothetical protein
VIDNVALRQAYPRIGLRGDVNHVRLGGAGELLGVSVPGVSKYERTGVVM